MQAPRLAKKTSEAATIEWQPESFSSTYFVLMAVGPTGAFQQIAQTKATSHTIKGLKKGSTYLFQV